MKNSIIRFLRPPLEKSKDEDRDYGRQEIADYMKKRGRCEAEVWLHRAKSESCFQQAIAKPR